FVHAPQFDGPPEEQVAPARRGPAHGVERGKRVEQVVDLAGPVEVVWPAPRRGMVAPREQVIARTLQPLDGTARLTGVPAETRRRLAAQRSAHAFRRIVERLLDPVREGLVEQAGRLSLGHYLERGIDTRLDGPLAQQVRTEPVDRADV